METMAAVYALFLEEVQLAAVIAYSTLIHSIILTA